jgi:hypothetical protein
MKERQVERATSTAQTSKKTTAETYFKEQVKNPGLFFCLQRADEWNKTEAFIRKVLQEYPNLRALVFYTGGRMETKPVAAHLLVIDRKDFNLFGKEKPVLRQWIEEQSFDLLLVFSRKENERCKKLSLAIKARLKAGWSLDSAEPIEDISLGKPSEKISYDVFYSELKKYFKQMNIKLLP